ncbi:MAG: hypothetical protein R3C97_04100 [Geminicoccaceae bacterium]
MVKEPRVTLWVFRLHQGEDCEGKSISGKVVASLDQTTQAKSPLYRRPRSRRSEAG